MFVYVNSQKQRVPAGQTVRDLLNSMNVQSTKDICVAVNDRALATKQWRETVLKEFDSVLLVQPYKQ